MVLLYISHLSTNIAAGLNWSVPASVDAQSKFDEVLWINMTDAVMAHWEKVQVYHNIREFSERLDTLDSLPSPFNHPDIVVFEGFYYMDDVRIAKMLRKRKIPYMIVPRGSLTTQALHNHAWLKKWVAHKLYFDGFVRHATVLQYLTHQEADASIGRFHTPYFIVPNGFNTPLAQKMSFHKKGIQAVFVGRLDMFHKGIDLLLDAITSIKNELLEARFHLSIYGPRRYDYFKIKELIEERNIADVVSLQEEISGVEKERVLLDADLFIMTSRFEGHPMGLIEALAYGLPCLVTPGSNMADEIQNADAGWTCKESKEDIASTIRTVIKEKDKFSVKGRNGRKLSMPYNWDKLSVVFHDNLAKMIH